MAGQNWKHTISVMGDSLSHNPTIGLAAHNFYPYKLQSLLRNAGCLVSVRNFGKAGDTTSPVSGKTGMTVRLPLMWNFSVPDIGIIYGGTNDPGSSISQATTQSNLQSMVNSLQQNGCSKVIIVGNHMANYSTGGDYDGSNNILTDVNSSHGTLVAAQKAAVAYFNGNPNVSVLYADLYNYMASLIPSQETLKSYSWHIVDQNYHFNDHGGQIVAQCIFNLMQTNGWVNLLK